jgi:hypothetical protein
LPTLGAGGSLAQSHTFLLVATPLQQSAARPQRGSAKRRRSASPRLERPLALIEGSLSARKVVRQAPWLAGLHRVTDGALVGLGVSMLGLSALTLHWQNQWGSSYRALEATQVLEHRLQESAALLEQHHLGAARKPGWLVPTSSDQLVHLPPPAARTEQSPLAAVTQGLQWRLIASGY